MSTVGVHTYIYSGTLCRTVFLHSYTETSWTDQVTRESLAERTIRATAHARRTLMAGFTSVRYACMLICLLSLTVLQ